MQSTDPVINQATPPNGTNTTGPADPATNATNATNQTGAGGGDDGPWWEDIESPIDVESPVEFPSAWEMFVNMVENGIADFQSGVMTLVDQYHFNLLTVSTADAYPPESGIWLAVAVTYGVVAGVLLPLVWAVGWTNMALPRGSSSRKQARRFGFVLIGILVGFPFLNLYNEMWNWAALEVAPAGEEFLNPADSDSLAKLGVGVILGAVLLFGFPFAILLGLGVHAALNILVFCAIAGWPVALTLWGGDALGSRTLGAIGIVAALAPGPLQLAKAIVLRFIFEAPLGASTDGAMGMILTIIGLLLAFVAIPWKGLTYTLPRSVMVAGGSPKALSKKGAAAGAQAVAPAKAKVLNGVRSVGGRNDLSKSKDLTNQPYRNAPTRTRSTSHTDTTAARQRVTPGDTDTRTRFNRRE